VLRPSPQPSPNGEGAIILSSPNITMTLPVTDSRQKLIALLQLAYSGELAAAYAYRGHWKSVRNAAQKTAIQNIENDEWRHRKLVGEMLAGLASGPSQRRETRANIIGRTLGFLCHVMGWLAPMYGAGRLESRNIREYETAARYAQECGRSDLVDCLLEMAEVEWDHEHYFRARVQEHFLGRRLPLWPQPPPKESIRISFAREPGTLSISI
jgi:rubrerythrin